MEVKILKEEHYRDLEDNINKWIKRNQLRCKIIDIKYTGAGSSAPYASDEYSAMIIYRLR